jgi:hypothetical protein
MVMIDRFALCGAVALVFATGAAFADTSACKLTQIASMEMFTEPSGVIAVPVVVNGAQHRFLVGTADPHTMLLAAFAESAHIPQKSINQQVTIHTPGGDAKRYGIVDSLVLGASAAKNLNLVIAPDDYPEDHDVVGSLGVDILANFDVEFDFAAHKLNLFSSDHCPNMGAYWARQYAELPIDMKPLGRPAASWTLDGQPVTVTFSMDSPGSSMPFNFAKTRFGLDPGSPGVETAQAEKDGTPAHRYRFKQLSAEGVTITNPLVRLLGEPAETPCDVKTRYEKNRDDRAPNVLRRVKCYGSGDVALGIRELSKMHLLFAFKENKLYFTAAGEH